MGIYKIFPAIGIARVGNSLQFYLAPEEAGGLPIPLTMNDDGTVKLPIEEAGTNFQKTDFRDGNGQGKMRRQAVRFRIYHYNDDDEPTEVKLKTLIDGKTVKKIIWTVRIANKKASWYEFQTKNGEDGYGPNHPLRNSDIEGDDNRRALMINPGSKTIDTDNGSQQTVLFNRAGGGTWPLDKQLYPEVTDFPVNQKTIDRLGEMHLDAEGHLIFVGGFGRSGSENNPPEIQNYANNDGWWDDTSDGTVSAQVVLYSEETITVESPAWVLVAPPAYAPQILNLVTLYDTMLDVAVRNMNYNTDIYENGLWKYDYQPNFEQEIKPILERASIFPWVTAIPPKPHTFDYTLLGNISPEYNSLRQYFFSQIRPPNEKNTLKSKTTGYPMMPYIAGDDATGSSQKSSKYLTLTDTQYFLLQQWAKGQHPAPAPRH